ncbi:MAG: hypothetical protein RR952_06675 [Cetobacterium sp.]
MVIEWYGKDKLNFKGERNLNNSNRITYNCGGYALETYSWYVPFDKKENNNFDRLRFTDQEKLDEKAYTYSRIITKEFRGRVRVIENMDELKLDEYAIAFRVGRGDIHFVKRNSVGNWYHKTGSQIDIKKMKKNEVFSNSWLGGRYTSKIILLAKKKNN